MCEAKDPKVRVTCSDGSIYTADQVLLTVSLGVLKKKAETMFVPALPGPKLNAISVSYLVRHWVVFGFIFGVIICLSLLQVFTVLHGVM